MTMLKNSMVTTALIAGLVSGILFLAPAASTVLGALLQLLTLIPLYYVSLGFGLNGALIASASGFTLVALMMPPAVSLMSYLGLSSLPVMAVAWQHERHGFRLTGKPLGMLLATMAVSLGLLAVIAAAYVNGAYADQGGVLGLSKAMAEAMMQAMGQGDNGSPQMDEVKQAFIASSHLLPLLMLGALMLAHVLNAVGAIALRTQRKEQEPASWSQLWLPRALAVAVVPLGFIAFAGGDIGLYAGLAAVALAGALMLQGLAVLHVTSRAWPMRGIILTAAYLLVFFTQESRIVLAALGVIDHWFDFRKQATA